MLKTLAPLQTVILGDAMLVSNFDAQLRQKVIFTSSEVFIRPPGRQVLCREKDKTERRDL